MSELYIGLMSGTSGDGIDSVIVDLSQNMPIVTASLYQPYNKEISNSILSLAKSSNDEIAKLGELDVKLGQEFAKTVNKLLSNANISPENIKAIGSHGQTIRHIPEKQYTLQIGDPNIIAANTGITTVSDFRRKDMAHGGQGAPLTPVFHKEVFASRDVNRAVVNIGGIANATFLACNSDNVIGFDTGPGNTLLDAWAKKNINKSYDENGDWAATGKTNRELLKHLLKDKYFSLKSPKSTGPEYFNLEWLNNYLPKQHNPADIQATLVELTATTIANAIKEKFNDYELLICGGGVQNQFLMQRLQELAKPNEVFSTEKYGINPDLLEAIAFAWLAKQTINKNTINFSKVTGSKQPCILGGVYFK